MERPDETGRVVAGRYTLEAVIGEGGVALVYRARDALTGKDLALKRLRAGSDATKRKHSLELFEREFHTLSQLEHPSVVAAYDFGVHDGEPYYTMELLDGGDLVDRSPLPWRLSCALARDVCSVLSLIHSRRMVYRDLSPRNIRCGSDGKAKVIDFGAMTAMGPSKLFVGIPAISSPEAVLLQPLDARSDLYALGATLYYALSGRRPFPRHAELCRAQLPAHGGDALAARYERLLREVQAPPVLVPYSVERDATMSDVTETHMHVPSPSPPEARDAQTSRRGAPGQ